jgi:hypothetical protein
MGGPRREHLKDLQGAVRLARDGTRGVVDVVESMHGTIQRFTLPVGTPPATKTFGVTELVYQGVRGGVEWVGEKLEAALEPWTRLIPPGAKPSPQRDAVVAALNGIWGDHLFATQNPLALEMSLRPGESTTLRAAGDRLLVLAHGLCMADSGWRQNGHDHGERLAAETNLMPLYLQYNSGLPVHHNGRSFAAMMEVITRRWPRPVEQIIMLGYSMGGLVARSACHYAEAEGYAWRSKLRQLITLGAPHLGSPLERGGTWFDFALGVSPYSAPIARLTRRRSAGIANLGHGSVTEDEREVVPLPEGVQCYAIAGSLSDGGRAGGDGLVPVASALGRDRKGDPVLAFPADHQAIVHGVSHLGLLGHAEAFVRMRDWIAAN